jgi:curved DNA-binding protein CbpA
MTDAVPRDPFAILGVNQDAGETEIRARYLELVKKFPPDSDPEKFREIRAAFEAVQDPLAIARRLLTPPPEEAPRWSNAIEEQKQVPPPLPVALMLSLGNRDSGYQSPAEDCPDIAEHASHDTAVQHDRDGTS